MKKYILILTGIVLAALAVFFFFIPAFAGEIVINPVISLGNLEIRWYGLILAGAIFSAYLVARKNSWKFGVSKENLDEYAFWLVIIGVLGARVYTVIFNWDFYSKNPSEIYQIWHGGLAIYGAILSCLIFTYFYARRKAYTFFHLFDLIALSLPLGQAIGRFGNFVNQEAYGLVTDLPWKMYIAADRQYHHPAFLYEAILDIAIFLILFKLLGKVKSGIIGLSYLFLYSLGRFLNEGIREDSFFGGNFRVDQIIAFCLVVISGFFILRKVAKN